MPSRRNENQEEVRFKLLRSVDANPEITQRELADEVGLSLGAVNYCLRAFVEKGFIKVKNFRNSNNKLAYAYLLTPRGVTEKSGLTGRFLRRKLQEYELLKAEIEALQRENASSGTTVSKNRSI